MGASWRTKIKSILAEEETGIEVTIAGWVRTFRSNRFMALNDGSTIKNLQVVIDFEKIGEDTLKKISTGACIKVRGAIVASQGKEQAVEMHANQLEVIGEANPEKYPLQPKRHSLEFLREIAHLRVRTNTFGAIYRIRHEMVFAVHQFFHKKGFLNVHTPIITGSDAEGAGEMFRVTALDLNNLPKTEDAAIDFHQDFFGKETNLTVSGQLEVETAAMAMADVYTFGPTFRAENSNTSRHLAEFWMIEPEMAFYDLNDTMDLAEEFVKSLVQHALEHCAEDLEFLNNRALEEEKSKPQQERSEMSLLERLNFVMEKDFVRISYTQAIEILRNSKPNKKKKFQFLIEDWGADLQSEHERYLVEKHFKQPVTVFDYPSDIKAFYMRQNEDRKTVAAMDVLFPGIGEIIGGSQREERYDKLYERIKALQIPEEELEWYLELRKFGTAPHSGFGLGFERFLQFVTGMNNIRDVIPFPRTPGYAEF